MGNAYIRVINDAGGSEIARYDLSEDSSTETAMIFGELYKNGSEWKFRAIGQGFAGGLEYFSGLLWCSGLSRQTCLGKIVFRHYFFFHLNK